MGKSIMPIRHKYIEEAISGIDSSGVYMVAKDSTGFYPTTNMGDDLGQTFLAQLSRTFLGTDANQFIQLFQFSFVLMGVFFGAVGFFLTLSSKRFAFVCTMALLMLGYYSYLIGDVYVMFFFASSCIPILVHLVHKSHNSISNLLILMFVFILCFSNFIRGHSGTMVLIFLIALILFKSKLGVLRRVSLLCIVALGVLFSGLSKSKLIETRNEYLTSVGYSKSLNDAHPMWHTIYIGMGFVGNETIPRYKDGVGIKRVLEENASVELFSPQYEEILKHASLNYISQNKSQFAINLAAKSGVIFLYILFFGGLGLVYCFINKDYHSCLLFAPSALFSTLMGFIAVPRPSYLLGLICILFYFTFYSFERVADLEDVKFPFLRLFYKIQSSIALLFTRIKQLCFAGNANSI